ncbi:MAG: hypothetical protein VW495_15810 [Rhodobiaceae bacterium]
MNGAVGPVTILAMVSMGFRIIGYGFGLVALYAIWLDLSSTGAPSIVLGQFWSERHLTSLLIGEAMVSRYIDPCGLIVSLGCAPFLWHPVIATLLGWPAALVFLLLMVFFAGLARVIRGRAERRISGRDLKRRGEK